MNSSTWRASYRGSALVALNSLRPTTGAQRSLDPHRVLRLCQIFAIEGCRKDEEAYRIRAVVSSHDLARYHIHLREVIGSQSIYNRLPDGETVVYVHGRHRLAAAQACLAPEQQYWPVDFHLDSELSGSARDIATNHYDNTQPYSDGIILRQIILAHPDSSEIPPRSANVWMSRLTASKQRDLKQVRRQTQLAELWLCLSNLVPYEGLWIDFKLGTLHRLLTLRCIPEIVTYLRSMTIFWGQILGPEYGYCMDATSIRLLQGRAPRIVTPDRQFIIAKFGDGTLFPAVQPQAARADLLNRCLTSPRQFPSLHTFIEDTKWLEPGAKVLQELFPRSKQSLRMSCRQCFQQRGVDHSFSKAYRYLWMYALRHFAILQPLQPRVEKRHGALREPAFTDLSPVRVLKAYANYLGFQVSNTPEMRDTTGDGINYTPYLGNNYSQEKFDLRRRCGRMFESCYEDAGNHLHYAHVYSNTIQGDYHNLSHFAVNQAIFKYFFGSEDDPCNNDHELENQGALQSQKLSYELLQSRIANIVSRDTMSGNQSVPSNDIGSGPYTEQRSGEQSTRQHNTTEQNTYHDTDTVTIDDQVMTSTPYAMTQTVTDEYPMTGVHTEAFASGVSHPTVLESHSVPLVVAPSSPMIHNPMAVVDPISSFTYDAAYTAMSGMMMSSTWVDSNINNSVELPTADTILRSEISATIPTGASTIATDNPYLQFSSAIGNIHDTRETAQIVSDVDCSVPHNLLPNEPVAIQVGELTKSDASVLGLLKAPRDRGQQARTGVSESRPKLYSRPDIHRYSKADKHLANRTAKRRIKSTVQSGEQRTKAASIHQQRAEEDSLDQLVSTSQEEHTLQTIVQAEQLMSPPQEPSQPMATPSAAERLEDTSVIPQDISSARIDLGSDPAVIPVKKPKAKLLLSQLLLLIRWSVLANTAGRSQIIASCKPVKNPSSGKFRPMDHQSQWPDQFRVQALFWDKPDFDIGLRKGKTWTRVVFDRDKRYFLFRPFSAKMVLEDQMLQDLSLVCIFPAELDFCNTARLPRIDERYLEEYNTWLADRNQPPVSEEDFLAYLEKEMHKHHHLFDCTIGSHPKRGNAATAGMSDVGASFSEATRGKSSMEDSLAILSQ